MGVSEIIAACGANVVGVRHERSDPNMAISSCFLRVSMETRDFEQIAQIRAKLTGNKEKTSCPHCLRIRADRGRRLFR